MNVVGRITQLVRRRPKTPKAQRPFKQPKYDWWYRLRYWASVSWQIGHTRISVYMLAVAFVMAVVIVTWHVGLAKTVADSFGLSYIAMYELAILIWGAAFVVVTLAFLSTLENRRTLADWLGFLPDRTRKRVLPTTQVTKMLTITRWACYFFFSWQVITILWWWSVFPNMPSEWHHLAPWRWQPIGPLLKQFWLWVSGFLITIHLERLWFVRRTRVPLIMASVGALFLGLYFLWWATNNLDYWIDFRGWFGS